MDRICDHGNRSHRLLSRRVARYSDTGCVPRGAGAEIFGDPEGRRGDACKAPMPNKFGMPGEWASSSSGLENERKKLEGKLHLLRGPTRFVASL